MPVKNRIQFRRGTSAQWSGTVDVLSFGEIGYDYEQKNVKVGNGTDVWDDLPWLPVVGVSGHIINPIVVGGVSGIFFDTSVDDIDRIPGQLTWDVNHNTMALGLTETLQTFVGEDIFYRVQNDTDSTIYKGQPVYASGATGGGGRITVAKYIGNGSIPEQRYIGIATEDIANGAIGFVTHFGYIKKFNTTTGNTSVNVNGETWSLGDILFPDPNTAGGLTKVQPKDGIFAAMIIGTGNNGELFVRRSNPGHLNDLHDVSTTGVVDNNFLVYNSGTELWEPTSNLYYVDGKLGIGQPAPTYQLEVDGSFSAATKSFKIRHPYSRKFNTLEYGSLESPYHGVRLTGKGEMKKGECVVKLPGYMKHLVKEEDISIQITNYKHGKTLYVDKIDLEKNCFTIKGDRIKTLKGLEFFWSFTAIRKDVDPLIVEK